MEYMSIKDLSAKFAMPERTVYHKISITSSIRTKKEGRTKLANVADFAKACDKPLQPLQSTAQVEPKNESTTVIADLQKSKNELQTKYDLVVAEKTSLEKFNRNLEEIAQNHALALKDEKQEKKERIEKYDTLQQKYHTKIEAFVKRYYLLLGLCITLIFILLYQFLPTILENYFLNGN
jgi:hypothetical protein